MMDLDRILNFLIPTLFVGLLFAAAYRALQGPIDQLFDWFKQAFFAVKDSFSEKAGDTFEVAEEIVYDNP